MRDFVEVVAISMRKRLPRFARNDGNRYMLELKNLQSQLALEFPSTAETSYTIRLSKRAKRLSIYLHNSGKVEIVAPQRASQKRIQTFIQEHKEWIDKNRVKLSEKSQYKDQSTRPEIIKLPFLNTQWRVVYNPSAKKLIEHADWIELPSAKSDIDIVKLIAKWLKVKAEVFITPLMQDLSNETLLKYRKLTFRGQKTRWGSCSPNGSINLNYCLLFLSEEYVRYVLIHELCHLQEMNHSRAFWNLVKTFEPKYKKLDKKLNDYWVNLPTWLDLRFEKANSDQEIIVLDV